MTGLNKQLIKCETQYYDIVEGYLKENDFLIDKYGRLYKIRPNTNIITNSSKKKKEIQNELLKLKADCRYGNNSGCKNCNVDCIKIFKKFPEQIQNDYAHIAPNDLTDENIDEIIENIIK